MRTARGFAIMSAIFLLVVLALLGAFMVNLSVMESSTAQLATSSSRAYYGARAGLEWAIHQAVSPAAGSGVCGAGTTFGPGGTGLAGVSVTVTCSLSTHPGSGGAVHYVYFLSSTASVGTLASADYAERRLTAQVCRSNVPTSLSC